MRVGECKREMERERERYQQGGGDLGDHPKVWQKLVVKMALVTVVMLKSYVCQWRVHSIATVCVVTVN